MQIRSFGPSNTSNNNNKTTRHKQMKQHISSTTLLYQSRKTQRGSLQDYNKHSKNSCIIAHIGICDAGNMRMKHGKNTSSYANMMRYAKHVDKTTRIIMKHYKKSLSSNHHQIIMWKASTTDTHPGLHAIVNTA